MTSVSLQWSGEVAAADAFEEGGGGEEHRGGGALLDALDEVGGNPSAPAASGVALEVGVDRAQASPRSRWCRRPATGRLHREEDTRGLGLTVGEPWIVGAESEVDVVERRRGLLMTGGADHDDAGGAVGGQRAVQASGESEVPEMVGGELPLPTLFGVLLRGRP